MRIDGQHTGPFPIHAAKAYGIQQPGRTGQVKAPSIAQPPDAIPVDALNRADTFKPSAPLNPLVAGKVSGQVDFNAAAPVQANMLQLYTRAADRVEAAIGVHLGRSLDIKG